MMAECNLILKAGDSEVIIVDQCCNTLVVEDGGIDLNISSEENTLVVEDTEQTINVEDTDCILQTQGDIINITGGTPIVYTEILTGVTSKVISHGLNKVPHVNFLDSSNNLSEVAWTYLTANTIQIETSPAFSGTLYAQ